MVVFLLLEPNLSIMEIIQVPGLFELYMNELKGASLALESARGLLTILLDYCSKNVALFDSQKV